jgi:hypothetical protein
MEVYCITIAKPRVPSKTLLGLSLKQDVFCIRFFFAVPFLFAIRMQDESFEEKTRQQQCSKNTLTLFILVMAR